MFPVSTHKHYWLFKDEQELYSLRQKANAEFIKRFSYKAEALNISRDEKTLYFLTNDEERLLLRYYEAQLIDFCKQFVPTMPKAVYDTAFHYMKRFYVNNSAMDFHPKEILVTCVYLACKVEEFNVTIKQFVQNVKGDREKAADVILNNELLLMQKLNYQLVVHNIHKPVEGLLLDIKVRSKLKSADKLRPDIDEAITKLYLTDTCLLYSPSQLALAVVLHAASKNQQNLDDYVTEKLLGENGSPYLADLINIIRKIRTVLTYVMDNTDSIPNKEKTKQLDAIPSKDKVKELEKRLEICRNEENNPNSESFKARLLEHLFDDD